MSKHSPNYKTLEPQAKVMAFGFWSAVLATLFSIDFSVSSIVSPSMEWHGIEAYAASFQTIQMLPVVPPLLLAPTFIVLMASIQPEPVAFSRSS